MKGVSRKSLIIDLPRRRLPEKELALPEVGFVINQRYRVLRPLGEGGMGRVFLVADLLRDDQPVALKTLHREFLSDKGVARFKEEFRAMTRLNHPNLARVFDFGLWEDSGEPYLTLEYLDGKDLSRWTSTEIRPLLPELIAQLCRALDYIHARGVLHNDIKPQNIFLLPGAGSESGEPFLAKVMDFGLARLADRSGTDGMSGTLHYTAPEVFRGEKVDARSDLYSLGVVLYRLATGSLPYAGKDPGAIIRAHREAPPAPPRTIDPTLPAGLERIILWLLEKTPQDRPASAAALLRALNEAMGSHFVLETRETRESYLTGAVLVGRETEMEVLRSALRSLRNRGKEPTAGTEVRLVLVGGESGSGKSRLLREFRYHVQTAGLLFLQGSCYETGGGVYHPFVEAFRQISPAVRTDLLAREPAGRLETPSARVLAPLFPDIFPGTGPEVRDAADGGGTEKARLFEAVTHVLSEVGSKRPFVLALEDLHWADALSIDFLRFLRDRSAGAPFLIVGTYRDDEVAGRPLEALASPASAPPSQVVLRLRRLEIDQIAQLVRSMLSLEEDPQELSLLLQRQTAGNPFFIEEILKALVEESALQRAEGHWRLDFAQLDRLEVPANINEALSRRLSKLTHEERRLARVLSVFNRPTSRGLLARAGGWEGGAMAARLSPLVARGLLVHSGEGGEEKIAFAHARTRDLVYRNLGPERTRLHLLAGELLTEASRDRPDEALEEVAYHFLQAGDKGRGLDYAERAGDKCLRLYAYGSAIELYEKALALLPRKDARRRMEIFSKMGRIHTQAANYTEMQDYLNRALRIARNLPDRLREGQLVASVAYGHFLQGHFDLAVRNARSALTILEPLGDHLGMGRAKNSIATAYARMGQFDEAIPHFVQALEHFEAAGHMENTVLVRTNLGSVHLCQNRIEEGLKLFREALGTWQQMGDKRGIAMAMGNISQALKDLGRFGEARESCAEAIRLHRETQDRTRLAHALMSMTEVELARGAYDEAMRHADESLRLRREIGEHFTVPHSLDLLGVAKRLSGDLDSAMQLHQEGLRIARENKNDLQEGFLSAALALDHLEAGKKGNEVALSAEKALVIGRRLRNRKIQALALWVLVAAALASSRVRDALARARDLDAQAAQGGSAEERFRALLALGHCRLAEGRRDEAEHLLEEALEVARRISRLDLTAEARLSLADLAEKGNRTERARSFLKGGEEAVRAIASSMEDSAVRRRYLSTGSRKNLLDRLSREESAGASGSLEEPSRERLPPVKLLATMYEISQIINTIRDPTELLNRVLDLAIQIVGAERGLIFLRNEATGELDVKVARNLEHETIRDAGEYSRHILQESQQGHSFVSTDAGADARFENFKSVSLYNIRSLLCVPLRIRDRILGTVYLDSRRPGTLFGDEDLEFLEAFSNQAAIAIENAQLYEALKQENLYLKKTVDARYGFENIVGKSSSIEKIVERISRVAESHLPVVIQGESGTGKELVARAIHYNSARGEKRFLSENVAALPESLLESELFGHVKGAFTGAEQDKAGLFELADGGTLFLDEIGEMSLSLQSKLLRVLQEGEVRPVGGSRLRKVDVRILAATNKDLKTMVAEKSFREDLYYRLNVVTITLPPLRQRKEDLPLLIDHFLHKMARERGTRPLKLDATVLALLARHDWPGNVRELENTLARLSVFATGPIITLADLARDPDLLDRVTDLPGNRKIAEPELRKEDLRQALRVTRGNRVQAAALLGISRATLFRKLKQFQIKP